MVSNSPKRYAILREHLRDIRWRLDAIAKAERAADKTKSAALLLANQLGRGDHMQVAADASAAAEENADSRAGAKNGFSKKTVNRFSFLDTPGPAHGLVRALRMIDGDF